MSTSVLFPLLKVLLSVIKVQMSKRKYSHGKWEQELLEREGLFLQSTNPAKRSGRVGVQQEGR
jgi:hypothetical protein